MDNENYTWERWAHRWCGDPRSGEKPFLVDLVENNDGSFTILSNHDFHVKTHACPKDGWAKAAIEIRKKIS